MIDRRLPGKVPRMPPALDAKCAWWHPDGSSIAGTATTPETALSSGEATGNCATYPRRTDLWCTSAAISLTYSLTHSSTYNLTPEWCGFICKWLNYGPI